MSDEKIQDTTEAHMGTPTNAVDDDSVMNSGQDITADTTLMEVRPRMDAEYAGGESAPVGVVVPKQEIELAPGSDGSAG
ncbi:MAG: hypothetical protein EOO38_19300 [Cytophagaceae bacterium]|nr:MAG: hypothetical protein EOO38_19300 [Cytophagaceae bacterium]